MNEPLHVGLQSVGKDTWIGGTIYIHNLVRSLRTLPGAEQPRLTLFESIWQKAARNLELAGQVEFARVYPPGPVSKWMTLRRQMRQAVRGRRYQSFEDELRFRGISVLFPLVRVPAADFPTPWLPWAWDFQHKYYPEFFSATEISRRDQVFAEMAAKARLIVVSSQNAAEDFARFLPEARSQVRVLRFTTVLPPEWFTLRVADYRARYNLPEKYLVVANQFFVHKNHRVVFEAMKLLRDRGQQVKVICTGNTVDPRDRAHFSRLDAFLTQNHLQDQVRFLGLLPRLDQIQVLRNAAAVIQPSLFEGWSTVVEDARALGKPIFLSNIAVHREQNPSGAIFFDPGNAETLAQAIRTAWPDLPSGVDLPQETAARARQEQVVQDFARQFMIIAAESAR